jgi:hypothetical protein
MSSFGQEVARLASVHQHYVIPALTKTTWTDVGEGIVAVFSIAVAVCLFIAGAIHTYSALTEAKRRRKN